MASSVPSAAHAVSTSPSPVSERDCRLSEDISGVELGVHVVEREADLVLAVADGPRHRAGSFVRREQRRMAVHDSEPRHGERFRWDLPREPGTEDDVRLEDP